MWLIISPTNLEHWFDEVLPGAEAEEGEGAVAARRLVRPEVLLAAYSYCEGVN